MRHVTRCAAAVAALVVGVKHAGAQMNEQTKAVAGGGITVSGWTGQVDASEAKNGQVLNNAKLAPEAGGGMHVTTGPSVAYWNPSNKATGTYTIKATFTEPKYMNLNDHPHPYGLFIGGNDLGTDQASYLYCTAYGNGNFIVRGFGPAPFRVNGRGEANDAVHKAAGPGQSVTQEIAMTVRPDAIECAVNGKTVGTYPKADLVQAGKLKSTDGIYGIRSGHNTEVIVTGLTKATPVTK